jgi:hypothetical protein
MRRALGAIIGTALLGVFLLPVNIKPTTAAQNAAEDQGMPSGNELLHDCKQAIRTVEGDTELTEMEFVDASHCTGYVLGVVDGYAVTEAAEKLRLHFSSSLVCFPKTGFMPTPRVVRIVVKYLHEHETRLSEPAALLVLQAMQEAYPCK